MESTNFCHEKFLEEYNVFLKQLNVLFVNEEEKNIINNLMKECESDKISRGRKFYDSIEEEYLFELFCKSKVRLFSSKDKNTVLVSSSLFGENLPLKKLINNQSSNTKDIIWKYLENRIDFSKARVVNMITCMYYQDLHGSRCVLHSRNWFVV